MMIEEVTQEYAYVCSIVLLLLVASKHAPTIIKDSSETSL